MSDDKPRHRDQLPADLRHRRVARGDRRGDRRGAAQPPHLRHHALATAASIRRRAPRSCASSSSRAACTACRSRCTSTELLERECPRLLMLLRQFPMSIEIHRTLAQARNAADPFVVADDHSVWHQLAPRAAARDCCAALAGGRHPDPAALRRDLGPVRARGLGDHAGPLNRQGFLRPAIFPPGCSLLEFRAGSDVLQGALHRSKPDTPRETDKAPLENQPQGSSKDEIHVPARRPDRRRPRRLRQDRNPAAGRAEGRGQAGRSRRRGSEARRGARPPRPPPAPRPPPPPAHRLPRRPPPRPTATSRAAPRRPASRSRPTRASSSFPPRSNRTPLGKAGLRAGFLFHTESSKEEGPDPFADRPRLAASLALAVPSEIENERRLRNSWPLQLSGGKPRSNTCTLKQSSPNPVHFRFASAASRSAKGSGPSSRVRSWRIGKAKRSHARLDEGGRGRSMP